MVRVRGRGCDWRTEEGSSASIPPRPDPPSSSPLSPTNTMFGGDVGCLTGVRTSQARRFNRSSHDSSAAKWTSHAPLGAGGSQGAPETKLGGVGIQTGGGNGHETLCDVGRASIGHSKAHEKRPEQATQLRVCAACNDPPFGSWGLRGPKLRAGLGGRTITINAEQLCSYPLLILSDF